MILLLINSNNFFYHEQSAFFDICNEIQLFEIWFLERLEYSNWFLFSEVIFKSNKVSVGIIAYAWNAKRFQTACVLLLVILPALSRISRNSEQKIILQTIEQLIQLSYLFLWTGHSSGLFFFETSRSWRGISLEALDK